MSPSLDTEQHATETQVAPVSDADATRGRHFRDLLGEWKTWAWTVGFVAGVGLVIGIPAGPDWGAGAAGVVLLIAIGVIFSVADGRAAADFHRAYAASRSYTLRTARQDLPPATDLLRKGVRRYSNATFAGRLGGRVDGVLSLYTYETETTDHKGNRHVQYHPFTIAITQPPGGAMFFGEVACQRRAGFRFFDKAEDAFRTRQRVELESEELDRRYEIFIGADDDMNRVKQLFSPSFIDWLNAGNEDLGFEFEGGMLVVNLPKHQDDGSELDAVAAAAAEIHDRIATEAREAAGPGARLTSSFDPYPLAAPETEAERAASKDKRRKGLIWTGVGLAVGLVIGFATYEDDDADTDGGGFGSSYTYDDFGRDPDRVTARDRKLLPLLVELDDADGVEAFELEGNGFSTYEAQDWLIDALFKGYVELDEESFAYHPTPEGERVAARSD